MNQRVDANNQPVDVSIIIVNWNTAELTLECLTSLAAIQSEVSTETILVDNASTDDSIARIRQAYPDVLILQNSRNVGFGVANNQAIERARGRYFHLVNSDAIVHPGAMRELLDFMESHPQAGACGSYYLNPDGTLQTSCYPFPTLGRELWRLLHLDVLRPFGVYRMEDWDDQLPRRVDVLQGASLFLRREALVQTGAFDPDYFMYTEEVDLCYRLHRAGWELYWQPASRIVHFGGQSTRQSAQAMFLHLYRSKYLFFRKQYGERAARRYKVILTVAAWLRLMAAPLAGFSAEPRRSQQRQTLQKYRELLKALPTF